MSMRSPVFLRGRRLLYYRDHYYPVDENAAYEFMSDHLSRATRTHDTKTRIILVPNGSYKICGSIMAEAYAKLCPETIKRIFVFGRTTSFLPYLCSLTSMDHLHTPVGSLPVDTEVNEELMKTGDFKYFDPPTDTSEQFVEMQLPFIAKVMENCTGRFKVVPVYIGTLAYEQLIVVARRFVGYLRDPQNAFVFSVSLCHWGQIYGYNTLQPDTTSVLESIKTVDANAVEALKQLRFKPFDHFLLDSKAKIFDSQIISLCLLIVQQLLDSELCGLLKLSDDKAEKAMQTTATFHLLGQAWSFPDVQPDDSCISYISASIALDQIKYIPEEPEEVNPLDKCC